MAAFWEAVLGWDRVADDPDGVEIVAPDGSKPSLVFVPVHDAKTGKNRVHLDVNPSGCEQPEELARLLALGAVEVDVGQGDRPGTSSPTRKATSSAFCGHGSTDPRRATAVLVVVAGVMGDCGLGKIRFDRRAFGGVTHWALAGARAEVTATG